MSTRFTEIRKIAQEETVGNRAHLYVHANPRTRRYNLPGSIDKPPMFDIPYQTYTFELHDECTRKVYLQLKKLKQIELREERRPQRPKRRYIVGFASLMRIRRPKEWEHRTSPTPS